MPDMGTMFLNQLQVENARSSSMIRQHMARIQEERDKWMSDPLYSEKIVAHYTRSLVPEKKLAKMGNDAPLGKLLNAVPDSDPRKRIAMETVSDSGRVIAENPQLHPVQAVSQSYLSRLEDEKEGIYKYIREGENKWFGKEDRPKLAGYEEWKKENPGYHWTSPSEGFAIGAGMYGASKIAGAIGKRIPGLAGKALQLVGSLGTAMEKSPIMAKVGGGVVGKTAAAGLLGIADMAAFDVGSNIVKNTEWAKQNSDSIAVPLAELGAGVVTGGIWQKALNKTLGNMFNKMDEAKKGVEEVGNKLAVIPSGQNIIDMDVANKRYFTEAARLSGMRINMLESNMKALGGNITPEIGEGGIGKKMLGKGGPIAQPPSGNIMKALPGSKTTPLPASDFLSSNDEFGMALNILKTYGGMGEDAARTALTMDSASAINKANKIKQIVNSRPDLIKDTEKLSVYKEMVKAGDDPILAVGKTDDVFAAAKIDNPHNVQNTAQQLVEHFDNIIVPRIKTHEDISSKLSGMVKAPIEPMEDVSIVDITPKLNLTVNKIGKDVSIIDTTPPTTNEPTQLITKPETSELSISAGGGSIGGKPPTTIPPMPKFDLSGNGEAAAKKWAKLNGILSKNGKLIEQPSPNQLEAWNSYVTFRSDLITKRAVDAERVAQETLSNELTNEVMSLTDMKSIFKGLDLTQSDALFNDQFAKMGKPGGMSRTAFSAFEEMYDKHIAKLSKGKLALFTGVGAGLALLAEGMVGLSDAKAGVIGQIRTSSIIERAVGKLFGFSLDDMIKALKDAGYVAPVVNPAEPKVVQDLMKFPRIIPNITNLIRERAKESKLWHKIASPYIQGEWLYGRTNVNGEQILGNPIVELAGRMQASAANCDHLTEVFGNIMKDVPNGESHAKEVAVAMKPLIDRGYYNYVTKAGFYKAEIPRMEELIAKEVEGITKASGGDRIAKELYVDTLRRGVVEYQEGLKKLEPMIDALNAERDVIIKDLASRFPSVRVELAVRGEGLDAANPWLASLLTNEEKAAAGHIRNMNDKLAKELLAVGERPITATPYGHFAAHPGVDFKKLRNELESISVLGDNTIPMAKIHSRSVNGMQMMPDIHFAMNDYIPDITKRLQILEFWGKHSGNGWYAHMKAVEQLGLTGASEFWSRVRKAFAPTENTTLNKMSRTMYALEVAVRLAASPSVAFKHLMKLEAPWSAFGIKETASVMPKTFSTYFRDVAADLAQGINSGRKPTKDLTTEVMHAFTNQNRLGSIISDMNLYEPPSTWAESLLQRFNEKGAFLVNNIERFDRAHSFLAAADMAAKRGMTAEDAAYGIMDTILKNNFLSGPFNPQWLREPKVRLMMMFQGTPFKILENRMLMAARAGKDVQGTLGVLNQLRKDVKEGEQIFKASMIKDSLSATKDIYGIPVSHQLVRKMMILGSIITGGKMIFDSDMAGHLVHIPGIAFEGGIKLKLNPMLNAALEAKSTEEDEFWLSKFFNKWLPSGPMPMIINRLGRLSEDDIPDIYKDSKLNYLLAVPRIKDK